MFLLWYLLKGGSLIAFNVLNILHLSCVWTLVTAVSSNILSLANWLSNLDIVQKCLHNLVGHELFSTIQHLSYRQNITSLSLLCCYFHDKSSDELYTLVLLVQLWLVIYSYDLSFHIHRDESSSLLLYFICKKSHSHSFFSRTPIL